MFQIYSDSVLIFDDSSPEQKRMAVSPKLTLSAGTAGSLSFTLPKGSLGYDVVQRLTSTISVLRDGETIWMGRALSEQKDVFGPRQIFCEGALAFLNDSVPMIADPTLSGVLTAHNAMVAANRQLVLGSCAYGSVEMEPDGYTSLSIVNQKLVGALGGVLRMRYPSGVPTLDWLANYPAVTGSEQELVFGENLLDFTRSWDLTDFATCCYVQGAEIEDSNGGTGFHYNSGWVESAAASTYGKIYKFLNYSDLDSAALCQQEAAAYLATQQFAEMSLQVTALDLHILNPGVKAFELLERVRVRSYVHGLDSTFAVTGIDIPLDAPENTSYTLGYVNTAYVRRVHTLTKQQLAQDQQLQENIDEADADSRERDDQLDTKIDDETEARISAIEETIRRMNAGTRGYVTIDYSATQGNEGTDGIYITDQKLSTEDGKTIAERIQEAGVQNMWKWTMDGLGFSDDAGTSYKVAITMDGEILCEFLKLYGNLSVFESKTGPLGGYLGYGLGNNGISSTDGIHMYDPTGNVEMIVSPDGARMSFGNYHMYLGSGGVVITGGGGLTCDLEVNGDLTVHGTINGQTI